MKFAFPLPHTLRLKAITRPWEAGVTGADQTRMAKSAEAMGYDMIAIPEHFVIPTDRSRQRTIVKLRHRLGRWPVGISLNSAVIDHRRTGVMRAEQAPSFRQQYEQQA